MTESARIDLTDAELDALIARVERAIEHELALSVEDMQWLLQALLSLAHLQERLADSDITLHKLRKLAGIVRASEKLKDVLPTAASQGESKRRHKAKKPPTPPTEPVIHARCTHRIEGLTKGERCPECARGTLYKYAPASFLRFSGQPPLKTTLHLQERLRCNLCGAYFTAEVSDQAQQDGGPGQQYGYSARALISLHKYYGGAPLYRQQTLNQMLGTPISASTAFDQCEHVANAGQPVVLQLIGLAANAVQFELDDTSNRILNQGPVEKPDRKTGKPKPRSGIYTSAVIATLDEGQRVVLFQTNIGHAGEWIDEILAKRSAQAPPPLIMSDALSHNQPTGVATYVKSLCNAHARREFVDLAHVFPEAVAQVLDDYALIWVHDDHCREQPLSAAERLAYHQQHSLPVMEGLREWGRQQFDSGAVEANSALGKAIRYFLRHYQGLTAFCHVAGAKLDNNELEATLKLIIRHRKNALFFKTLAGAAVADTLTSLIATCEKASVNAFDYLVVLQRHAAAVKQQPARWLPWTYQATLAAISAEQKAA
jgi:hypothetical protein